VFQNVNGIHKANSWLELNKLATNINQTQIDVFSAAKTNIKWKFKYNNQARAIMRKHTKQCCITTSSNVEQCLSSYQPGGTMTAIMNKFLGHVTSPIIDNSSLGRWSGYKLRTSFKSHLNILTVYQPTRSDSIHSTFQQQAHYYKKLGFANPNPRKLLLRDLTKLVQEFNSANDRTIIMIDANDSLFTTDSLLPQFLSECNLTSLIMNPQHHPHTHTRGSACIDFILGSPSILEHVQASGISPFFSNP
jgi:hypothetical protein